MGRAGKRERYASKAEQMLKGSCIAQRLTYMVALYCHGGTALCAAGLWRSGTATRRSLASPRSAAAR